MQTIALTYRRVSTDKQERDGTSIEAQQQDCRRYVKQKGWTLGSEHKDIMSGRRDDRPGYRALLDEARRLRKAGQPVVVVVAALDRLGRRLKEQVSAREELTSLGVPVHFVREGGELPELTANLLASVAQEESARTGRRVREGRAYTTSRGFRPVGRVAWGYRLDDATEAERRLGSPRKVLREDPLEADAVREMFCRAASGTSIRQLTVWVASLPASARGGRTLEYPMVRDRLSAPLYVARPDRPTNIPALNRPIGHWPALIDDATWVEAQANIARHRTLPRQGRSYLLNGLIRCPKDGLRMQGQHKEGRHIYRCGIPFKGCYASALLEVIDAQVMAAVSSTLEPLTTDPGMASRLRVAWKRLQAPERKGDGQRSVRALEQVAEKARTRLDAAMDALLDGTIDKAAYDRAVERYTAEAAAATAELASHKESSTATVLPELGTVLAQSRSWHEILAGADIGAQRNVLALLIERVVPERVGRGRYRATISWTPLGEALRQLTDATSAA
jgi:site-specific DNA recombinase